MKKGQLSVMLFLQLLPVLLGISTWTRADKIDDLLPQMLERLDYVRQVLAPIPQEVLDEAIYNLASYYIPVDAETELCRNHSSVLFDSFINKEIWALKMLDASSKGGPGILDGNIMDLGNFDQCVSVVAPEQLFTGQHCVVETRGVLPGDMDNFNPKRPVMPILRIDLMFSVCVPSSCTAQDVKTHMDVALNSVNASAIIYNSSCSSAQSLPLHTIDYTVIIILFLLIMLVIISTLLDQDESKNETQGLLKSFSLKHNGCQLMNTETPAHMLSCLHGLRVVALAWLMLGYRMLHFLASPVFRFKYLTENIDRVAWAPVENAQLGVEIYFLVTGVIVSYTFFRRRADGTPFSYFKFISYHYLRLITPIAVMSLLYATIFIRLTDGPIWRRYFQFEQDFCQAHWWTNLLFINNYVNPYELCMPQTWYLAIEFQLYILSPLLLVPLYRKPKLGGVLLAAAFIATIVGGMINAYSLRIHAGGLIRIDRSSEGTNVCEFFYTQYRAASFLLGILLGLVLFRFKEGGLTVKLTKTQCTLGWLTSLVLILVSVCSISIFQQSTHQYTPWLDTAYGILHRPALSLGVGWVILVSSLGYARVLNALLSWKALVPLSKLTYCAFLVHFVIQDIHAFSTRTSITLDFLNLFYIFFADLVVSYILAAVLHLTVEAPANNLIALLFKVKTHRLEKQQSKPHLPAFFSNTLLTDKELFSILGVCNRVHKAEAECRSEAVSVANSLV